MNKYNALNAGYDQLYPQPMKHASTHAKDGADPITPSSIGAYSKEKTDTLLQKKAPSGYGYDGANSSLLLLNFISGDTVDDKLTTLFNSMTDESAVQICLSDTSFSGYEMHGTLYKLSNYHGGYATAVFNGYDNYAGIPVTVRKVLREGVWGPYEYFTPPMYIGVEYRTTERYLGKPVYVRLHDFGALPNSTFKEDSSPASWSIDKAICAYGTTSDGITIPTNNYAGMITDGRRISMYFMRTEVTIATDGNFTSVSATLFLKYTKTTD